MRTLFLSLLSIVVLAGCQSSTPVKAQTPKATPKVPVQIPETAQVATLGGGCFWCLEAVFERMDGVYKVESGFAGGTVANPTYKQVCSGETGHAEVVQVWFDPETVSYDKLLDVFWNIHDPTSLNRQGNDEGTPYRSAIFYADPEQKAAALGSLKKAQAEFTRPIVTEVVPLQTFYPAEEYHQDFFARNPNQGYCQMVVAPKVRKFEDHFPDTLRK